MKDRSRFQNMHWAQSFYYMTRRSEHILWKTVCKARLNGLFFKIRWFVITRRVQWNRHSQINSRWRQVKCQVAVWNHQLRAIRCGKTEPALAASLSVRPAPKCSGGGCGRFCPRPTCLPLFMHSTLNCVHVFQVLTYILRFVFYVGLHTPCPVFQVLIPYIYIYACLFNNSYYLLANKQIYTCM